MRPVTPKPQHLPEAPEQHGQVQPPQNQEPQHESEDKRDGSSSAEPQHLQTPATQHELNGEQQKQQQQQTQHLREGSSTPKAPRRQECPADHEDNGVGAVPERSGSTTPQPQPQPDTTTTTEVEALRKAHADAVAQWDRERTALVGERDKLAADLAAARLLAEQVLQRNSKEIADCIKDKELAQAAACDARMAKAAAEDVLAAKMSRESYMDNTRAHFMEHIERNKLELGNVRAMLEVSDQALKDAYIEIDGLQARLKSSMDAPVPTTVSPASKEALEGANAARDAALAGRVHDADKHAHDMEHLQAELARLTTVSANKESGGA